MRNIIPENATIQTGDTGILAICDCDEQRPDDTLLAHGARYYVDENGEKVPTGDNWDYVYVTREGRATNRYADGMVGVTDEDAEAAETDEELFCEGCGDYIRGWLHTADE